MALYVIDINEKSAKGKQLKRLMTEKQPAVKFYSLDEYERQEEQAFIAVLKEAEDTGKGSLKKVKTHLDKVISGK